MKNAHKIHVDVADDSGNMITEEYFGFTDEGVRDFYEMVGNYLLQKAQRKVIERKLF